MSAAPVSPQPAGRHASSPVPRPPPPRQEFVSPQHISFFSSYFTFATRADVTALVLAAILTVFEAALAMVLPIVLFLQPSMSIARSPFPWYFWRDASDIFRMFKENGYYNMLLGFAVCMLCLAGARKYFVDVVRERMEAKVGGCDDYEQNVENESSVPAVWKK